MPGFPSDDTHSVETVSDLSRRDGPSTQDRLYLWTNRLCEIGGEPLVLCRQMGTILPEDRPPSFCGGHRRTGALPDDCSFVFGEHRQQLKRQPVRLRYIRRSNIDPRLQQLGDERQRPRKSIQPRNQEYRLLTAAKIQRRRKLRPIPDRSTFDLGEGGDDELAGSGCIPLDGFVLRFQAKAGSLLFTGRDAGVCDEGHDAGSGYGWIRRSSVFRF